MTPELHNHHIRKGTPHQMREIAILRVFLKGLLSNSDGMMVRDVRSYQVQVQLNVPALTARLPVKPPAPRTRPTFLSPQLNISSPPPRDPPKISVLDLQRRHFIIDIL